MSSGSKGTKVAAIIAAVGIAGALGWLLARGSAPTADVHEGDGDAAGQATDAGPSAATGGAAADATTPTIAVAVADASATPSADGARLEGRVVDSTGVPQAGVALALLAADGARLTATSSDADGRYALADATLAGAAVAVGDATQPLEPGLARAEVRHLDLIVGATREVRGFVLDLNGDPVGGVVVTLRAMAFEGWQVGVSRKNGTVVFPRAPATELRLEAYDETLGADAGWVSAGSRQASVDLVLEPTAELTVEAGAPGGRVMVRNPSPLALGPDKSWQRSLAREQAVERARVLAMIDAIYPELRPEGADAMPLPELSAALERALSALPPETLAAYQARRTPERLAALQEATDRAIAAIPPDPPGESAIEKHGTIASGPVGATFRLAAGYRYDIALARPGGPERWCGAVLLRVGDHATVDCDARGVAKVHGRLVDRAGRPLASAPLELAVERGGRPQRATTDATGAFAFAVPVDGANLAAIAVALDAAPDGPTALARRGLRLAANADLDLGVIVARPDADALPPTEPYAGTGGTVGFDETGVVVTAMELMSPLELAGLEVGDTLIAADGEPLDSLSLPEVADRLRGAEGSLVELRVRDLDGELYDVTVERGTVVPRPTEVPAPTPAPEPR